MPTTTRARPTGAALPPTLRNFARLGELRYRPLDELKRYTRSLRKHPEAQLRKLAAAIEEFGFLVPVLVDHEGVIIAGEARAEAARRAGLHEVPTLSAAHLSPAQIKAFRVADNRLSELSSWEEEALVVELKEIMAIDEVPIELLGWETAELDVILAGPSTGGNGSDPADEPVAPPVEPVSRLGDLWHLGRHRLLCGSSLDPASWTGLLDGKTASMMFTDPPYNVKIDGHVSGQGKIKHADFQMASGEMSEAEFVTFLATFLQAAKPHLADGAILDLCMDHKHMFELLTAIRTARLNYLTTCVWNKSNGGMGSLYRSKFELVVLAKVGTARHTNNIQLGKFGRNRTSVWDYAGVNAFGATRLEDLADHPTVKPVALVADAICDVTHHGEIVLDAFMGSGTTILAAERTERVCYGIEIEPRYVDVAIRRWEALTGAQATLAATGESIAAVAARRQAEGDGDGR